MVKWIDFESWKFNKAFYHYLDKLHYTFGNNKITNDMRQGFNHNYSIKYKNNWKIIKDKLENETTNNK